MNYPLISEYIEAIKSAEDNFEELNYLRPVLGDDGLPVMSSGNFAVVFKMKDEQTGKLFAVKCFTKEQEGRVEAYHQIVGALKDVDSPYLVSPRYLDKELFVDTEQTTETEFPVLLMDWVEGKTLDKYLREHLDDKYALEILAYRFSQLAQWLIPQPFAHGDLKPDNIIVREDGTLVLVDYDGMYVPAMKGQKARELGSPDFRHPLRTENDFDEHIDDFPIISILLSLKAIANHFELWGLYSAPGRLLLSEMDYRDIGSCKILKEVFPSYDIVLNISVSSIILALCIPKMDISHIILSLVIPLDKISTTATNTEIEEGFLDNEGILYSKNGHKLLKGDWYSGSGIYTVHDGTQVICDNAFTNSEAGRGGPTTLILPSSLFAIGKDAFKSIYIPNVSELLVPNGYSDSFKKLNPQYRHFVYDISLSTESTDSEIAEGIIDEEDVLYSKNGVKLLNCNKRASIKEYSIKNGTKVICDGAFAASCHFNGFGAYVPDPYETMLTKIILPDSILRIGSGAFNHCSQLKDIIIPDSCIYIGCSAFWGTGLEVIDIPSSVLFVESMAFGLCHNLRQIVLKGLPHFGSHVFYEANIEKIIIPKGTRQYFENELPELKNFLIENKL